MATHSMAEAIEKRVLSTLMQVPWLRRYVRTHGWPFVLTWVHRATGVLLVFYLWFHIYTLSLLQSPDLFAAKMKSFQFFLFVLLEWLLAIPVVYHTLNGARLILYESFGNRKDLAAVRWVMVLSLGYVALMGVMMLLGDQVVSATFFWLFTLLLSFCLCYTVISHIWRTPNTPAWRLQRISGSFLLIMIPAHLLFMHLNPAAGHEAAQIIERMRNGLVKAVDLLLISATLYHGGYGLISLAKDYLPSRSIQAGCGLCILLLMLLFGWIGIKLIFSV